MSDGLEGLTLKKALEGFLKDDKESVDQFNNLNSWSSPGIERRLDFLSWRVLHMCNFVAIMASIVSSRIEPSEIEIPAERLEILE